MKFSDTTDRAQQLARCDFGVFGSKSRVSRRLRGCVHLSVAGHPIHPSRIFFWMYKNILLGVGQHQKHA